MQIRRISAVINSWSISFAYIFNVTLSCIITSISHLHIEGTSGNLRVSIGCLNCFESSYWSISPLIIEDKMSELFLLNVYSPFMFWLLLCGHIHFAPFVTATSKHGVVSAEEIIFPPRFVPSSNPNFPSGHLKMFGLQRPPIGPVTEYRKVLRPQEFWKSHVSQNRPLVFRQAIADSPAIKKWTDDYLKQTFGDLDVLTELKTENRTHGVTSRMLFGDFIDIYTKKDLYVVTVLPDPMRQDLPVCNRFYLKMLLLRSQEI